MAVTLISSPTELPADAAPGLVVLLGEHPGDTAAEVAELMGGAPVRTPSQAAAQLDALPRGSLAAGGGTALDKTRREVALEVARQEAADALARVPPAARGVAPERVYGAAAAVRAAQEATVDARMLLGERPDLSLDAAQAALSAEEAVARADEERAAAIDRSCMLLLGANAVAILVVAGRVRTPVVEPLFVLVAACPLTGLVHLFATVVSGTRDARAAARQRSAALRSTGMATMTGLAARHARVKAWTARAHELAAAEATLAQARRRWAALAGPSADPAHAEALVGAMAEADRAAAALAGLEADVAEEEPDLGGGLVVLVEGAADLPLDGDTVTFLERVNGEGAPVTVVVVTARSEIGSWADAHAGGQVAAEVVDLRERVLASLSRLRARAAAFGDTTPPGPMAADG